MDILVHEEELNKIVKIMTDKLCFEEKGKSFHDVSLFSSSGVNFELHYVLVKHNKANDADKVLCDVWNYAFPAKECEYKMKLQDEMFYFYHIAHMAKHFQIGGCGIKPFIDLWILDHMIKSDIKKRDEILQRGNLLKFANVVRKLSRVWFENEEYDTLSKQMEAYIIYGGVYGNIGNKVMVQQQKRGGRLKYALSKIFIPYDAIKFQYPILNKHRWMTPFMEVRRWCRLIFCGHIRRSIDELKYNKNISSERAKATQQFLMDIGL